MAKKLWSLAASRTTIRRDGSSGPAVVTAPVLGSVAVTAASSAARTTGASAGSESRSTSSLAGPGCPDSSPTVDIGANTTAKLASAIRSPRGEMTMK